MTIPIMDAVVNPADIEILSLFCNSFLSQVFSDKCFIFVLSRYRLQLINNVIFEEKRDVFKILMQIFSRTLKHTVKHWKFNLMVCMTIIELVCAINVS